MTLEMLFKTVPKPLVSHPNFKPTGCSPLHAEEAGSKSTDRVGAKNWLKCCVFPLLPLHFWSWKKQLLLDNSDPDSCGSALLMDHIPHCPIYHVVQLPGLPLTGAVVGSEPSPMALVCSVVYHVLNLALISAVLQSLQNLHVLIRRDTLRWITF